MHLHRLNQERTAVGGSPVETFSSFSFLLLPAVLYPVEGREGGGREGGREGGRMERGRMERGTEEEEREDVGWREEGEREE